MLLPYFSLETSYITEILMRYLATNMLLFWPKKKKKELRKLAFCRDIFGQRCRLIIRWSSIGRTENRYTISTSSLLFCNLCCIYCLIMSIVSLGMPFFNIHSCADSFVLLHWCFVPPDIISFNCKCICLSQQINLMKINHQSSTSYHW